MAAPTTGGDAPDRGQSRAYRLVSASFQDKAYRDGTIWVDGTGSEIELRQLTGKRKKKEEVVVARFRLEPNSEVLVDGALLRVSGLSVTMESPAVAGEVADLLRRPARERDALRGLSEVESCLGGFLAAREEALNLLSRMKVDPRAALLSVESMWTTDDTDPLAAVYSSYSARLSESLEKTKSSLAREEKNLGSALTETLFALANAVGAVQNALFEGGPDLTQELASLQELGIAATAQDLRLEKTTERLLARAHQPLVALATARPPST